MIDRVVCRNPNMNLEAAFGFAAFEPFLLQHLDGVSGVEITNAMSDNTMTNGAVYLGSVIGKRNIVISGKMMGDGQEQRDLLYRCFEMGVLGEMLLRDTSGKTRKISYYPESVDADGGGPVKTFQVSLICPDPYFYGAEETVVMMSYWIPKFQFLHEFKLEELGMRHYQESKTIILARDVGLIGATFRIECDYDVTNISISNTETGEKITIGSSTYPFTLYKGDVLEVTTHENNKRVTLTRKGGSSENANQYLVAGGGFPMLKGGRNTIVITAEAGKEYIDSMFTYWERFTGV